MLKPPAVPHIFVVKLRKIEQIIKPLSLICYVVDGEKVFCILKKRIVSVIKISKKGIVVTADTVSDDGLKLNQNVQIDLKYKEIAFNVDGQVKNINGRIVDIAFVNVDKLTSTVMLFLSMFSENL